MTEFMRPTVTTEEVNDTVARYIVEPLERGYGNTLGNSMRRVLLSSLDGAKATAIQIEGVQHEFTTAEGVIEDIADIVTIDVVAGTAPAEALARYADKNGCDLIVMGRRGLGAIRGMLGSVSFGLLRSTDVPVLTVK